MCSHIPNWGEQMVRYYGYYSNVSRGNRRKIIQIYYNNADSINAALERSPALRVFTKKVLEVIAPVVGKKE